VASGKTDSQPYAALKDIQPLMTTCEVCDNRQIKTKDWTAHKNSKGHRKKEAVAGKENQDNANIASSNAWGEVQDAPSAWNNASGLVSADPDGFSAVGGGNNRGGRKFNGQCHGCGQEGHPKRDCPQSGGNRGCFNCGQLG
jgi:cellular nucleic acid-binding protein